MGWRSAESPSSPSGGKTWGVERGGLQLRAKNNTGVNRKQNNIFVKRRRCNNRRGGQGDDNMTNVCVESPNWAKLGWIVSVHHLARCKEDGAASPFKNDHYDFSADSCSFMLFMRVRDNRLIVAVKISTPPSYMYHLDVSLECCQMLDLVLSCLSRESRQSNNWGNT